jgi:hypothetical protein
MSGKPGPWARLRMIGWDFRSKVVAVFGSKAAVRAGHGHRGTGGAPSWRCARSGAQSGPPGLGVVSEPAVPVGRAVLCGAPDICGTARVVNEMTCLGSPMTLGGRRPDCPNALGLDFKSA